MGKPLLKEISLDKHRKQKRGFNRFLDWVEKNGNKLPDVLTLFLIITICILLASMAAGLSGWSAVNPSNNETVKAVNLLNEEGIKRMMTDMVKNFVNFPPLGLVLVVMLGVGLAESTGLISAFMRKIVLASPKKLILPIIVLIGIIGNAAADAALIVLPPVAAMVFLTLGRHPIAGLAAAYAAVAGGFSANVIISMLDVMLAGFTESSAHIVDKAYKANPAMNYYFLFVSTFVLVPVAVWVTTKIVEPRLGLYKKPEDAGSTSEKLTDAEQRGLKWAGISLFAYVALILAVTVPEGAMLRDPKTDGIIVSPFMDGLVPIMFLFFLIPALFYGFGARVLKSDKDVAEHLTKAMSGMGYYIVLSFIAAQMITYFAWSNLGTIIAIKGADTLKAIGWEGLPLLLAFIIFTAFVNLLIASSSAKWAILGPVFVPMFMMMDISPAATQVVYRIGDSITNVITPMLAYFAILLTVAKKFDKNMGMGTLISALLPYSIAYTIFWTILFAVWYVLGLPLGPGEYIKMG
ncbi:AbgT family transporter [Fictibacillus aquaticus]|uniref:Aminobenzoyl-glutamate transporter n=1 Tax=Fictibacillus aquaticus TaxID=2021314 RepID=A0A235FF21_9BACL|nr:AbgT family transporter [Fictibacillus aquaticus]OYD59544.1 aminobenzoyl-glutamate transporter [Fictibacillus aquaticus]